MNSPTVYIEMGCNGSLKARDVRNRWDELQTLRGGSRPSGAAAPAVDAVEPIARQRFTLHPAPFLWRLARYCTFRRQTPLFWFGFFDGLVLLT